MYAFNEISTFECVVCKRICTQAPYAINGLLHCAVCFRMPEWLRRGRVNDPSMPSVAKDMTEYRAS